MHSNLPHISQNNLYQFITFRTQDSTDAYLLELSRLDMKQSHLLVQYQELAKVMQKIKGGLSFLINKELQRKGTFWQKDYFDKVIRDERHLETVLKYIKNNAIKAGLSDADERFYICEDF